MSNKKPGSTVPSPAPIISEGNSETIQTPVESGKELIEQNPLMAGLGNRKAKKTRDTHATFMCTAAPAERLPDIKKEKYMKSIFSVITASVLLFGCSPSKQHVKTLKKTEVISVTVADSSLNGGTKTISRQKNLRLFIELDKDWLKLTTVYRSEHIKKKITTTNYYKPETLLKFSTGDWYNIDNLTKPCPTCTGKGQRPCPACKYKSESTVCPRCLTNESEGTLPCNDCEGTGTVKRQ